MQFVRSVAAQCYRRGKPLGRRDFSSSSGRSLHNGAKGMANRIPEKPVEPRGSEAPGLAVFFGFTGYIIWQMVENRRISKAADKEIEFHREARLRKIRLIEGSREKSRPIDKKEAKANN